MQKIRLTVLALIVAVLGIAGCQTTGGGASALNPNYRPVFDTAQGIDNNKLLNDNIQCTALARQAVSSGGGVDPATGTLAGAAVGAGAGGLTGSGQNALIGALVGAAAGYGLTAQNQNQGVDMARLNMAYYNCLVGRGWRPINTP